MNLQLAHNCHGIAVEVEAALNHYAYTITTSHKKTDIEIAAIIQTEQMLDRLRAIGPVATWKLLESAINDSK